MPVGAQPEIRRVSAEQLRRWSWPIAFSTVLAVSSIFPLAPLIDLSNPDALPAGTLHFPIAYHLLAPASVTLDTLTLLAPSQYLGTLGLGAIACIVCVALRSSSRGGRVSRRLLTLVFRLVFGALGLAELALVARRPMASLTLPDPELLAVDFHSHTSASHDGRPSFGAEENREWHSSAGFAAAYVTDHRTLEGAASGANGNPGLAGRGTTLLPGVELRDGDEHPILIGIDPMRTRITSDDWQPALIGRDNDPTPAVLLLSLPGDLLRVPPEMIGGRVRVAGIELSDGSPRGIAQAGRDREMIRTFATRSRVATVSGSDNHGWGRTAPAWSVMRIPGWKTMTPTELDVAIRRTLIAEGSRAVQVVARRSAPIPETTAGVVISGFAVGVVLLRTMSVADRISCCLWCWTLCALLRLPSQLKHRSVVRIRTPARENADVGAAASV
ncbi:MAG TPA: hypothetical protein VJ825_04160 [Gemmatimonadaceae bacterium]|nr:hypothetical protein [Gemmatimonadaceae bacterium]